MFVHIVMSFQHTQCCIMVIKLPCSLYSNIYSQCLFAPWCNSEMCLCVLMFSNCIKVTNCNRIWGLQLHVMPRSSTAAATTNLHSCQITKLLMTHHSATRKLSSAQSEDVSQTSESAPLTDFHFLKMTVPPLMCISATVQPPRSLTWAPRPRLCS